MWPFKRNPWIYGYCRDRIARKHKKEGNVQFILWEKGQQGHKEDYWHDFDSYWWNEFTPLEDLCISKK